MIDLTTRYLGLELRNPVVCSSSPLCQDLEALRRMEEAGAGAVVLHSLFEEQLTLESLDLSRYLDQGTEGYAESPSYFPDMSRYNLGPEGYLEHVAQAKGLLDGGADALELNVYEIATDPERSAARVEDDLVGLVGDVVREVRIPVAVKLGPFYTAPAHLARRVAAAGAKGLVLFNRFYQPDFDLESLDVVPSLWLSTADELRLRLHWVAILEGRVEADLAVTGGVHTERDVVKAVLAGASVAMMTSALLRHGVEHLAGVLAGLRDWMEEHEYRSVAMMRGAMSFRSVASPAVFERANYLKVLRSHALYPLRD